MSFKEKILKEVKRLKDSKIIYDSLFWMKKNAFFTTVDIALFSVKDGELCVFLIKRESKKDNPFGGHWALPGGYIDLDNDEDALSAAKRELKEETGIDGIYLEQLYTFSSKYRDPRDFISNSPIRTISIAHMALIDYKKINAIAGSDAEDVAWFPVSKLPNLAFDHEHIIKTGLERVRGKISYSNVGFELLPKEFTIPEMQKMFEDVIGDKLDRNNFRQKILSLDILKETGRLDSARVGKPSKFYSLKEDALSKLNKKGLF